MSFEGVYEKEGVYPDDNGRKLIYKFRGVHYRHRWNVFVDFTLNDKEQGGGLYLVKFSKAHFYMGIRPIK
ncbi:hypothetical protein [Raoultella terrigena]|uniref:hypothetical protein n=1 Tax=Raoultella terrigena TaxID=577 RepID=UPI00384BC66F